jgi:hypothetical protein
MANTRNTIVIPPVVEEQAGKAVLRKTVGRRKAGKAPIKSTDMIDTTRNKLRELGLLLDAIEKMEEIPSTPPRGTQAYQARCSQAPARPRPEPSTPPRGTQAYQARGSQAPARPRPVLEALRRSTQNGRPSLPNGFQISCNIRNSPYEVYPKVYSNGHTLYHIVAVPMTAQPDLGLFDMARNAGYIQQTLRKSVQVARAPHYGH